MSQYCAKISWQRAHNEDFIDNKYSRAHQWQFDGGLSVPASSSPTIVPLPYSAAENVDPEEAFVAALSSCHMLFFLSIAAKKGFTVNSYTDNAIGEMGKNPQNKTAMTKVALHPAVVFADEKQPTKAELEDIHHLAHKQCYIANSVTTEVITIIK